MRTIDKDELEIILATKLKGFIKPKAELEQYATPSQIVATIVHHAHLSGQIENKTIVDLCAGTGQFAIAGALKGAQKVFAVEYDSDAISLLKENVGTTETEVVIIQADGRTWNPPEKVDTVFLNPPFGIKQKKFKDSQFIKQAFQYANTVYAIVDGVKKNIQFYSKMAEDNGWELKGLYAENFDLPAKLNFHKKRRKQIPVLILQFLRK